MTVELTLVLPAALRRSDHAPVTVRLRNAGDQPVVVNTRMAPGYATSRAREVWLEVGGREDVSRRDYEREHAGPDDFAPLPPGAVVEGAFVLLDWYRFAAGAHRVIACYEADERGAAYPDDVLRGVVRSPVYELAVR
ncbi:MAG: hypothetical protein ABW328_21205 [Ilumatobacteraceae bacterium]